MKFKAWILVAVTFAVVGTGAHAFQETQVGGATPPAPSVSTPADRATPAGKVLDLSVSENKTGGKSSGIELRVPGLGKLGVLPKLDFGLELLYGAAEPQETVPGRPPQDDVTIRGSIKHRF